MKNQFPVQTGLRAISQGIFSNFNLKCNTLCRQIHLLKLRAEGYRESNIMNRYSVVIPCFNSSAWLETLAVRIDEVFASMNASYELILVNDSSSDETWRTICELAGAKSSKVKGIDLASRSGQFRAVICGFEHSLGDVVITMDDDLQHDPKDIPRLVQALQSNPEIDCVIGSFAKKRHSWLRNLGSRAMAILNQYAYGKPVNLQLTTFRALRRPVVDAICSHGTINPIIAPMLLRSTRRIMNVPVTHHERPYGKSNYRTFSLIRTFSGHFLYSSTLPLKIVSTLGIASVVGSAFGGALYLYRYLLGNHPPPGYTSIVLLILFFGGMTLFSIGVLGEYIAKVIEEVARAPRYVVRQVKGNSLQARPGQIELAQRNSLKFDRQAESTLIEALDQRKALDGWDKHPDVITRDPLVQQVSDPHST